MSTQNVNFARFARNVEWDFFCDFQTSCCVAFVGNPIWSFAQALGLLSSKLFIIFWWFIAANLELGVISLKLEEQHTKRTNSVREKREARDTFTVMPNTFRNMENKGKLKSLKYIVKVLIYRLDFCSRDFRGFLNWIEI